jgi:hypothetical protein
MNRIYSLTFFLAASAGSVIAQPSTSTDFWDFSQGVFVTASSDIFPGYSVNAMFGLNGQNNNDGYTWTYFSDTQPAGFTHFVEWETPGDVRLGEVRLFAFGDSFFGIPNNEREFAQFTLKAKSPGSLTYDITILTFTPTHPYTLIDPLSRLALDQMITPVTAHEFRAEFVQYTAGDGFDGPRIVELDGLPLPGPLITASPENVVVNYAMPALFKVEAIGTGTLHYQWSKDGTPLSDETGAELRIHSVSQSDVGAYTVTIADDNSPTTSAPATLILDDLNIQQSFADLWDVHSGLTITAHSDYHPAAFSPEGMFGGYNGTSGSDSTYFADNMPTGTVHYVEWTAPAPVSVRTIRLFAHGDRELNNGREFNKLTIKAKSPGSSTFSLPVITFTPTHPYTFFDNDLILDAEITPMVASAFRAEFTQYTAGFGFDGPRIVELDAFDTRPLVRPTLLTDLESQTIAKNSRVSFHVLARGGSLRYQWRFMGRDISGATTDTLTLKHAKATDQGYYTVAVSNNAGSVESAQALLLVTGK